MFGHMFDAAFDRVFGSSVAWKLLSHHMIISDGDVVWSGRSHSVQRQQTHETIFLKTILKKVPSGIV
jgi:hypothetical protein